ncbi:Hsp20/alpha crystallin family protein [Salegentibacter sp. JZCK2]|uniref:Hsp20/alpha crystallin family protein n=1 Tax=Salegentibacter tibetensis TaxID=2873600 RepID=UPI001CC90F77|nr:Hsp20/alpha crystallin family protein [Salegentibacter tibetensis]MBZ9730974.1 Hsp20/alpha crystallin family protein [Salegentibacter tibetensis]
MSIIKSNNRRTPALGRSILANDPFFSDLLDTKRGIFNLNRFFNGDFDQDLFPALNVKEKETEFEIELAAPGLSKQDFKISIEEGILSISAEKENKVEEEKEGFVRKEFSYNSFSRQIALPEEVDMEKEVEAKYKEGILKMSLKKRKIDKSKKTKTVNVS